MPTVLLVEDDGALRSIFKRALEMSGFVVHEATNGRDALHMLAPVDPDVLVTDLVMPVLDGVGLVRTKETRPDVAHIPVLLMTASDTSGIPLSYPVLHKPFSLHEFVAAVRQLL